jgi:RNA polymerase sigma factor (sigma-70 family)
MAAVALCDRLPAGPPAVRPRGVATITNLEAPLIRRAQAGSSDAFGELYGRHEPKVRRYLASRLGSGHGADIDDLVAETFLTAMERISAFQLNRPGEFGNWLIGIARNKLLTWRMRPSRRETATDELPPPRDAYAASPSPEEVVCDRLELAEALAKLTPRARRALVLQHAAGLPTAEVALAMGTTKRSVSTLTGLARQTLRGEGAACACGCGVAIAPHRRYATRACHQRATATRVRCACGCGAALPAVRHHRRRYATIRCRNRAAYQRRKEAQRRYLAGPVTADPAVGRVLQLVQAAGSRALSRGELSRRTRFLASRLDRALDLLARRHLISVDLEPSDGRLVVRYRALPAATARRAA